LLEVLPIRLLCLCHYVTFRLQNTGDKLSRIQFYLIIILHVAVLNLCLYTPYVLCHVDTEVVDAREGMNIKIIRYGSEKKIWSICN